MGGADEPTGADRSEDSTDGIERPGGSTDGTGCPKCGHAGVEAETIATTGGGFAALADWHNRAFRVVECTRCGYCELYSGSSEETAVDMFLGKEFRGGASKRTATRKSNGPVHHCSMCGSVVDDTADTCPSCDRTFT